MGINSGSNSRTASEGKLSAPYLFKTMVFMVTKLISYLQWCVCVCQLQERREAELRAKREEEERKRRDEKRRQEEQKRREEEELFRRKQVCFCHLLSIACIQFVCICECLLKACR